MPQIQDDDEWFEKRIENLAAAQSTSNPKRSPEHFPDIEARCRTPSAPGGAPPVPSVRFPCGHVFPFRCEIGSRVRGRARAVFCLTDAEACLEDCRFDSCSVQNVIDRL